MILTVTLNAAVDKTLAVPNFRLGHRHRAVQQTTAPGGKGVNVARVLQTLGQPVIATGLTGGATGTRIVDGLADQSVLSAFVRIKEESRTNTSVIDPTTGEQTEINERGPAVSEAEIEMFEDKLRYLAKGASICVLAGSLPRHVPFDIYGQLIRHLREQNVITVVDTDGEPMRQAVRAEPDFIFPNLLEAEELVGHEFLDEDDRINALLEMARLGAGNVVMTAEDGCYALNRGETKGGTKRLFRARLPVGQIDARATVGSGDALLAGFISSLYSGSSIEAALAHGVACGAESTQHLGAGIVSSDEVARLCDSVQVDELATPPVKH